MRLTSHISDMAGSASLISRRSVFLGAAAALCAPAIARAEIAGTRRLNLFRADTDEAFDGVYYADGLYEPEAMVQLDTLLRDVNADESIMMDVRLYDVLAETQSRIETSKPIRVTSGFRTRANNEALRRRTRWASKNSLHIQGMAADFTIPGVRGSTLAKAAKSLKMGGVGTYSGASFIHVDVGAVRAWRR